MKSIKVIVEEDGSVVIEAIGFKGKNCEKATEGLAKALGVVTSSKKKPEWFQTETAQQKVGT